MLRPPSFGLCCCWYGEEQAIGKVSAGGTSASPIQKAETSYEKCRQRIRAPDLHAIMEQRAGKDARGSIGYVIGQFECSTELTSLSERTQLDYTKFAREYGKFKTN